LPSSAICSDEGADILILARSDARQAESLEEALWRAAAFADAGADMLFIDALASKEEMLAFTQLGGAAAGLPKVRCCEPWYALAPCWLRVVLLRHYSRSWPSSWWRRWKTFFLP
jgi:hypothetical protein